MSAWYASSVLDLRELEPEGPRLLRRWEFERMLESGLFEEERVELLRGVVVRMTPPSPPHDATIQRLTRILVNAVGSQAWVRINSAWAATDDSEPMPDVCIVPPGAYDAEHPTVAWLMIEVARSSLRKDRSIKRSLYAECGVEEYWVVNLVDGVIEVYGDPRNGQYASERVFQRGTRITLARLPDIVVAVDEVLPP
jgi:Uma2 family endonuclease